MPSDLRIREIIADFITPCSMAPEEMRDNTRLVDDLGADSLEIIEMTMALEEEFEIAIPDAAAEEFKTVRDIVRCVHDAEAKNAS